MHILFLDESGTAPPKGKNSDKYFVIGGVTIPEDHWHELNRELSAIKKEYGITGELKWRYFSPHNKDKENSLLNLSFEQKNEVRNKVFKLIIGFKSIKIISIVTDIKEAYSLSYIKNHEDLYWYSYKQVVERFQYHLQDISRESGASFNGIVIIDNRQTCNDEKLRALHSHLLHSETETTSKFANLIESLFIAPSHLSVGIQFADMVTGAIFRKYEKGDSKFFDMIQKSIRHRKGTIEGYGIVLFPKKTTSG